MNCTQVEAVFYEDWVNDRLWFGDPLSAEYLDEARRCYTFGAGQVFGYVWWERNTYGTQYWACAVLSASAPGRDAYALPRVEPGADVYLYAAGQGKARPGPVERCLALIDSIRAGGYSPEWVPAAYWRAAAFAIRAQQTPRPLTDREYYAALQAKAV